MTIPGLFSCPDSIHDFLSNFVANSFSLIGCQQSLLPSGNIPLQFEVNIHFIHTQTLTEYQHKGNKERN